MQTALRTVLSISVLILVVWSGCSDDDDNDFTGGTQTITGSGNIVQETRMVSGFSNVTMAAAGEIDITQGGVEGLVIRGDDNLLQYIRTNVVGNTLEIALRPGVNLVPTLPIEFDLDLINLDNLVISGVATVDTLALNSNQLRIVNSGVATIDLENLTVSDLDVLHSGVGEFRLSGTTDTQDVTVTGVGDYEAENLQSREATVLISGLGSATVRVSDLFTATITGSGDINYYGSPTVNSSVTGSGSVVRLGP